MINNPTQDDLKSNAVKQDKVQKNYSSGSAKYVPQKVDNVQYHSRVEDPSTKIPAGFNRQSSTLIYSSESGDLGKFNYYLT